MATKPFGKAMDDARAKFVKQVDQVRRGAIFELFSLVITTTPVDKGFLRGAWQTQVNSPNLGSISRPDKSGQLAILEVLENMGKLGDTVFFTNTMPYARRIEYDSWSQQAPQGMLRVNILRWDQIVESKIKVFMKP